jgi:trans-aconitate 2-methyltransferase
MPFDELVSMCDPADGGLVYDVGCGPGSLTAELPDRLDAGLVIGTDTSPAMLEKARPLANDRLRFVEGDLRQLVAEKPAAIIFSNAAMQWVDDHEAVLSTWRDQLAPGGQLAVQVPANGVHPAYGLARRMGQELADWFPGEPPTLAPDTVGPPERYSELLYELGAADQQVQLRVFPHVLQSTNQVTEWIKGTALNSYRHALDDDRFETFLRLYTERLIAEVGDHSPYLFTFRRILMWARF